MSDIRICDHCEMDIAIRNPSGFCDHLYYPDNCEVCQDQMCPNVAMKPRKLTKEDIGKKFRREEWHHKSWFKPLGLSEDGCRWIGEKNYHPTCESGSYDIGIEEEWIPYEEPKKKVMMAPALIRRSMSGKISYIISDTIYSSLEDSRNGEEDCEGIRKVIQWPASPNLMIEVEVEDV